MKLINVYITTLLIKMKAFYYFLVMVHSVGLTGCCSVENISNVVENAIVSCLDSSWCPAKCYRGFIFPTGLQQVSYSCKNGIWTPLLSSCKRLPVVSITYSAEWYFTEILPSTCNGISTRLNDLKEEMVDKFANQCQQLQGIYATVQINYSLLSFTVTAKFTAVYQNYTTRSTLSICIDYTVITIPNVLNFTTMFDDVPCTDLNTSNAIFKSFIVSERLEYCFNGTEVHNVTKSGSEIEQFCDFRNTFTSDTTLTMATDQTTLSLSSHKTTTFATEDWFTENNDYFNATKSTDYLSINNIEEESLIYIAAPAVGVLVISVIIIFVVCVKKRVKSQQSLQAVENKVNYHSFKGELIENELYQSADNAIDSTGNIDNTEINMSDSSKAPSCTGLTQTEQELKQDQYSYPSKCKETNVSTDDKIDKLDTNTAVRGHHKTLNFDPDSDCQYTVVRE